MRLSRVMGQRSNAINASEPDSPEPVAAIQDVTASRSDSPDPESGEQPIASRPRPAMLTALLRLPDVLVALALIALLVIVFTNIICREIFGFSFLWEEEATQLCMTVLAFIGGAVCYRSEYLVSFNWFRDKLNSRFGVRAYHAAFVAAFSFATAILLCYYGRQLAGQDWASTTPLLQFSTGWFDVILIVGAGLLALYALARLAELRWRAAAVGLAVVVVLAAIEYGLKDLGVASGSGAALWTGLISLALFIGLGVPLPIAFTVASIVYIGNGTLGPPTSGPSAMVSELNNFILVAIPLFVLAGLLLTAGGLSRKLLAALELVLGRVRGGIGHSVVISMYLFSGISGSKLADVAAVGSAIADDSVRLGLKRSDLAALLSASAVMGETVPPSVALLVAATTANVSVLAVFAAGILPAAVIGLLLMVSVWRLAPKQRAPLPKNSAVHNLKLTAGAIPAVAIAALLVGGLITGIASPSETSAVACVAALVVGIAMGGLRPRALLAVTARTSQVVGMVLFLITSANAFAYGLTLGGVPQEVANGLSSLKGTPWLFLLATIVVLPLIGLVLEGLPAILITVPLLIPVAQELKINPILYVVVMVLCLGLGTFLPPLGIGLYTSARICDVEVSSVTRRLVGYMVPVVIGILVIAFIPQISLVVPRLLGLHP